MEMQKLSENENKLYRRKEVDFVATLDKTPSKKELIEAIAKKFSAGKDAIAIKKVDGKFGTRQFRITANIYNSKKDLDETEHFSKKEKEKMAKLFEQPKEEAPAAEAATEEVAA